MDADDADLDGPADFDETFREHYTPMVRSLSVACGDREAAADAVQAAFTRCLRPVAAHLAVTNIPPAGSATSP